MTTSDIVVSALHWDWKSLSIWNWQFLLHFLLGEVEQRKRSLQDRFREHFTSWRISTFSTVAYQGCHWWKQSIEVQHKHTKQNSTEIGWGVNDYVRSSAPLSSLSPQPVSSSTCCSTLCTLASSIPCSTNNSISLPTCSRDKMWCDAKCHLLICTCTATIHSNKVLTKIEDCFH